jgi:hypothetical protein
VGGEFRANTTAYGNHTYPAAAMDADGDFVIAWAGFGEDPGDTTNQSGVYAQRYAEPRPPNGPRVTQVYVSSQLWPASFFNYLEAQGLGSHLYGFAVGDGAGQLADLPWKNLDLVSVRFDGEATVGLANLSVRGVNVPNYGVNSLVNNVGTHTATWRLTQFLAADKVMLELTGVTGNGQALDGEWATGGTFPSGDGTPGGAFRYRMDVLPGNVNRTGSVLADDFSGVKARFFTSLPGPEPAGAPWASRPRTVRAELFGSVPVAG